MINAVKPGGLVLDLQVIRPNPIVEADVITKLRSTAPPGMFRRAP
jgi:hypothetical protein